MSTLLWLQCGCGVDGCALHTINHTALPSSRARKGLTCTRVRFELRGGPTQRRLADSIVWHYSRGLVVQAALLIALPSRCSSHCVPALLASSASGCPRTDGVTVGPWAAALCLNSLVVKSHSKTLAGSACYGRACLLVCRESRVECRVIGRVSGEHESRAGPVLGT